MAQTFLPRIVAVAGLLVLGGCSGNDFSRTFGFTRDAPDEFTVTTRAPLSMPPDYTLHPPRPGTPRPQENSTRHDAEAALAPQAALGTAAPGTDSPGQDALVQAAGPAAPANIRQEIESEASLDQPDQSLTDKLLFWKKTPPPGIVVDPNREAQRLRENAALGQSPEVGDTPIIQRKSEPLLNGLF
jgi:hypothetical protein